MTITKVFGSAPYPHLINYRDNVPSNRYARKHCNLALPACCQAALSNFLSHKYTHTIISTYPLNFVVVEILHSTPIFILNKQHK